MKKRLFMLLGTFLLSATVPVLSSARQTGSDLSTTLWCGSTMGARWRSPWIHIPW